MMIVEFLILFISVVGTALIWSICPTSRSRTQPRIKEEEEEEDSGRSSSPIPSRSLQSDSIKLYSNSNYPRIEEEDSGRSPFLVPNSVHHYSNSNYILVALLAALVVPGSCVPATLFVDKSGTKPGSHRTVQAAVDAVPAPNKEWIIIQIGAGRFWEQVRIPNNKPYLILKGKGRQLTEIVFDGNNKTDDSSTFQTNGAPNLVIKHLSIRNSYNWFLKHKTAVAAYLKGDMMYLYDVGFYGYQDTLWDHTGRHFFKNCVIEGAVDFIFGNGRSIYEDSLISVIGRGFITAQGRDSPEDNTRFVFNKCVINGTEMTLLGRAWRPYAVTIFSRSYLHASINVSGWDSWNASSGHEHQLTYAEYSCYGPGADTTRRVSWESHLSPAEVLAFTDMEYINASDWLYTPPYQKY